MPVRRSETAPLVRARFVTRARYLKDQDEYWDRLAGERKLWDRRFPQFAIGRPSWPPEDVSDDHPPALLIYPPTLARAVQRLEEHLRPATWHPEQHGDAAARDEWRRLVQRLVMAWWPDRHFPPWRSPSGSHPAVAFVSASLVWRREAISEEWIVHGPVLGIAALAPDAFGAWPGEFTYVSTVAALLDRALADAGTRGVGLPPDEIAELRARVNSTARAAAAEVETSERRSWPHAVPLMSGMTSTDWRELVPRAMQMHSDLFGRQSLRRLAQDLRENGMNEVAIAGELGISPRQVGRILKDHDDT